MNPVRWHLLLVGGTTVGLAWSELAPVRTHLRAEVSDLVRHLRQSASDLGGEYRMLRAGWRREIRGLRRALVQLRNEF